MTMSSTDLRDVGTLIACALRPKLRPAADPTYRALLDRYRTQPEFRNATVAVLDGMEMRPLNDTADLGLVLGTRRESLFAYRMSDIPNVSGVEQRLIVGLITAAVAAYAFPTPASFDDERVRYVSVSHLERFVREECERLKRDAEPAVDDEALEEAWRLYERMPPVHRPQQGRTAGRLSPSCSTYWVTTVLDWLCNQGLAKPAVARGTDSYQLLERFRIQVRETSGHAAYKLLATARAGDSGPDATVAPPLEFDPGSPSLPVDLADLDDPRRPDRRTEMSSTDLGGTDPDVADVAAESEETA